jgi:hypothetical protein
LVATGLADHFKFVIWAFLFRHFCRTGNAGHRSPWPGLNEFLHAELVVGMGFANAGILSVIQLARPLPTELPVDE